MSDLHEMLQPWSPGDGDPWDSTKAAHLLNRAGFGGTLAEVEKVRQMGPQAAVDWLLSFPDQTAKDHDGSAPDLSIVADVPKDQKDMQGMVAGKTPDEHRMIMERFMRENREVIPYIVKWWIDRMSTAQYPLQEKLTLFWHGHFTSSARDIKSASFMVNQNELMRKFAAGNFEAFLHNIARDPAMLDYLNNSQNRKKAPNENFAREVMELFTLGVGNYTEADVKEAARAFTGWNHIGSEFQFQPRQHDFGPKTFLGQTYAFNGDGILEVILSQPKCARFVAAKIFSFFVHPINDQALADSLGNLLWESRYQLRPLVRTILISKAFYSADTIGAQIKSPIQYIVGTRRLLGADPVPQVFLIAGLNLLGQAPFLPPNVGGWPGGRAWINTSTILLRQNLALRMLMGDPANQVRRNPDNAFRRPDLSFPTGTADQVVDQWIARFIQRPISAESRKVLVDALGDFPANQGRQLDIAQLILSMPEYQLC